MEARAIIAVPDSGRAAAAGVTLAVVSAAIGVGLTAVALMFGDLAPVVLIGLPVFGLVAAAALARPRVAVYAILATFPLGSIAVPTGFASFEAVEVCVLAFGSVVVLSRLAKGRTALPWVPELWWLVALIGWTLLALPSGLDQQLGIKQIAQLIGGLFYACVVVAACNDERDVRRVLIAFLVVTTGISVVAIATGGDAQVAFGGAAVKDRAQGTFDQPNQLGLFSGLASVVAAGAMLAARSWRERIGMIVVLGVAVGAMLLSLSRGAWIGAACAIAFLALTLKEQRMRILAVALPLIVVGLALGAYAPRSPQVRIVSQRLESFAVLSPYDDRPAIYREAFREIQADPWTGQGPGSFPVASARAVSEVSTATADHAHNLWLTWAAESGIPAALLLTGFMAALLHLGVRIVRSRSGRQRTLMLAVGASLVVVLGQGIVDYPLRNAVLFYSVWTLVGLLLAGRRIFLEAHPPPDSLPPSGAVPPSPTAVD